MNQTCLYFFFRKPIELILVAKEISFANNFSQIDMTQNFCEQTLFIFCGEIFAKIIFGHRRELNGVS